MYTDPYQNLIKEYFDMTDIKTVRSLTSLDEADQNNILSALSSKLYDAIVSKVDDIDFGTIPKSNGDITKIQNYAEILACLQTISGILNEFRQDDTPVRIILTAIKNLEDGKELFERAFKLKVQMPVIMYNTLALAVVSSTSFLIASSVEFIKNPSHDNFDIEINKVALGKTKDHLLFTNLQKFNESYESKAFEEMIDHVIKTAINSPKKLSEGVLGVVANVIQYILTFGVGLLRDLIFFFYNTRMKISDWCEIQANLMQMNAYRLQNSNSTTTVDKDKVVQRQYVVANNLRNISNKFMIKTKSAEVKTEKEIRETPKNKIDDVAADVKLDSMSLF